MGKSRVTAKAVATKVVTAKAGLHDVNFIRPCDKLRVTGIDAAGVKGVTIKAGCG